MQTDDIDLLNAAMILEVPVQLDIKETIDIDANIRPVLEESVKHPPSVDVPAVVHPPQRKSY